MSRRGITIIGLAAAGGAGYYLYTAGGDPKAAQKHAEGSSPILLDPVERANKFHVADASKLSSQVKGQLPGSGKEAEKRGEAYASQAGKKFDSAVDSARAKAAEAEKKAEELSKDSKAKFEKYRQETGQSVNAAIDKFDKTVEKKTSEAKSGISSWFGLGGK